MKVLILHIGDIHVTENLDLSSKAEKIASVVNSKKVGVSLALVLITGDIANHGKQKEYLTAKIIIDDILRKIGGCEKIKVKIFMVPGNHDCDLSDDQSIREILIDSLNNRSSSVTDLMIENICRVQKSYFDFQNHYHKEYTPKYESSLYSQYSIDFQKFEIKINCFNMAWLSTINEKQGALYFPVEKYEEIISGPRTGLVISLFHHPFIWQSAIKYRRFLEVVEKNSNIILTGHEHFFGGYSKCDFLGHNIKYMEGGVLNDNENVINSLFNVALVDLENSEIVSFSYQYNGSMYELKSPETQEPLNLVRCDSDALLLASDMKAYIEDAGATFTHPVVENLKLDDIFIYPDFKNLKLRKARITYDEVVSSRSIIDKLSVNEKIIVVGSERAGKTTLCKKAFSKYYMGGYIPIFIKGTEIGSGSLVDFEKLVIKKFINQYHSANNTKFENLENNKLAIIIDDFDRSKINLRTKGKLLSEINERYSKIFLTANEFFQIEELAYEENQDKFVLKNFGQYKLLHFGHQLRLKIIEQWFKIGREHEIEEADLLRQCDKGKQLIDSVIGKNLVPSYPIFLLILLQSIEAGTPHDLKSGSHGYYYNYLISQAFGRAKLKSDEFESYYNFSSIVAYYMYRNNVRSISDAELLEIFNDIREKHIVVDTFEKFKNILIEAKIIDMEYGNIEIKYKYIYYFFVAKYISDHLEEKEVCDKFRYMCGMLHVEQYANIVLFLSHHSKNKMIADVILESSRKIFSEYNPIDLKNDVKVINDLIKEIPKYVLKKKSIIEYRDEKLKIEDKIDSIERNVKVDEIKEDEETYSDLDLVQKVNASFKTMEILGQMIKTYYGTMPKETSVDIAEEAYCITLRALKSFFIFLENNIDLVVSDINKRINIEGIRDKEDIEDYSKRMVFFLSSLITSGFIKKLSGAIGSDKLNEIYNLTHGRIKTISSKLINSAICLDFSYRFPTKEIKEINKENNLLVFEVVRRMTLDYLYMFNTNIMEKQQICEMLKISIAEQRIIDNISTQKKE